MNKCNVIKDLLPLYADEVCSEDSRKMVEEHLSSCKECKQELEDYRYNTGLPEVSTDAVMKSFKKKMNKKNFVKIAVSVVLCLAVIFGGYYIMFVPEYVVPYSENLLDAKIPVDGGIDVWVNLKNYTEVETWEKKDENGGTNIYLTVMQNNWTKLVADNDKSDNFWRAGNNITVCYQSGIVDPLGGENPEIKNIYYLEMDPKEALYMIDGISFDNYETQLIWSATEK